MRFILIVVFFMTAAFNLCFAESSASYILNSSVEGSSCDECSNSESNQSESSHDNHGCQECHSCHVGFVYQNAEGMPPSIHRGEFPSYNFIHPKLHYEMPKRPPIARA